MVIHVLAAVLLDELVPLGGFQVFSRHFGDQFVDADLGRPAEFGLGLGGVAQQGFDFGGTEVARVDGDDKFSLSPGPSPACGGGGYQLPFSSTPRPSRWMSMPSPLAAALAKSRTLNCLPAAMVKSSGLSAVKKASKVAGWGRSSTVRAPGLMGVF